MNIARDVRMTAPVGERLHPVGSLGVGVSGNSRCERIRSLLEHSRPARPLRAIDVLERKERDSTLGFHPGRGCSRVPDIAQHRWKDGRDVSEPAGPSLSHVAIVAAHADHVKADVPGLHATQPFSGCAGDNS